MSTPLHHPESLLQFYADCVHDHALFTLDPAGAVTSWNRGAERMFGYREREILGRSCAALYSQDATGHLELVRELAMAAEKGIYETGSVRVRQDGGQLSVYVVMTPLRDENGQLTGYAVITRDITERQRSLHEIQDHKRRLKSILETAVDAVIIIDERGIIENFNPAAERTFGYRADEVIGRNVTLLMPEPFASEHTGYLQRYLRTGQAKIIGVGREIQARRKDGSLFPADLAVSEFYDDKPLFTGVLRDISERKKLESEVLQIAESEQRRIGQELHDDAQQQLSALTMFARSAADLLSKVDSTDSKLADARNRLDRVVQGLKQANQSLRTVARGLVPLQVESHGLCDALRQLAAQVSESHPVQCRCAFDAGTEIDDTSVATHLYRIAQEAVNNALKHADAKEIEIRLRAGDRAISLEVADDGIGIEDSQEQNGRGLQIMAYRAGLIGGVLKVRHDEGRSGFGDPKNPGTVVNCTLPVA